MTFERGRLFDDVAEEYDRVRLGYPVEIVDAACAIAGLGPGSSVLEIGCGTGKFTEVLAARSLHVEAVDPGAPMVDIARRRVGSGADVTFRIGRFEDIELPTETFAAAFSATAFHWVDPAVGWAKVADLLRPDGIFALVTYTGASPLDEQFHAAWAQVSSESESWVMRDRETLFEGVEARLGNMSEAWAWLNQRDHLARPEVAELFGDARLTTVTAEIEETTESVIAVMRTTSSYLALEPDGQQRLEDGIAAAVDSVGGSYTMAIDYVLVTGRAAG